MYILFFVQKTFFLKFTIFFYGNFQYKSLVKK
nr:MAG TPA: hypothetical protein [Caudoviricetes sp.]